MSSAIFTEVRRRKLFEAAQTQWVLTGGGVKRSDGTGAIWWTERFIAISIARGPKWSTTSHFNIIMPPDGTSIPILSDGSFVVVSGGKIIANNWSALWYIPPFGSSEVSRPENFRITTYDLGTSWEVPEDWILVAVRNHDPSTPYVKWGDGDVTDRWRPAPLENGWVNYGTWVGAEYQMVHGNRVFIRGLVANGGHPIIFMLPEGYRPSGRLIFAAQTNPNTIGRLDIDSNGAVIMHAGSTVWFSISCNFIADQ